MHQVIPPSLGGSVKRQAQNCSQGMWQGVCTSGKGSQRLPEEAWPPAGEERG